MTLLESLQWWVGFNEGDLEIVRLKVYKILNFEFFSLKIQLNKKIQLENDFG
jgi:hypothetical protein